MRSIFTSTVTPLSILVSLGAIAGCGRAAISTELATARDTVAQARAGSAARFEADQIRAAERTLARAEQAPDGSPLEQDLAYLADRQARVAIVDARRASNAQLTTAQERVYQRELERVAREREEALQARAQDLAEVRRELADVRGELSSHDRALGERTAELEQAEQALSAREAELLDAERRASEALARVAELSQVRQEPDRTVITIPGEVLFETNRAVLRASARERLGAVADALRESEGATIVIEGHTDARGSDADNGVLSQRRADAVRGFLRSQGVPSERLRAVGRGEAEPIADNGTPEGRAENRRVEIEISRDRDERVSVR